MQPLRLHQVFKKLADHNWHLESQRIGYTIPFEGKTRPTYHFVYQNLHSLSDIADHTRSRQLYIINNDSKHRILTGWCYDGLKMIPNDLKSLLKSLGIIMPASKAEERFDCISRD